MGKYIVAIDQSTSGTKALLVNSDGAVLGRSSAEHKQYYPEPGWVEHDPIAIYENVKECVLGVLEQTGTAANEIAVLTLTNQRETAVIWDRITGLPVYNAIVWQCQRTAGACDSLRSDGHESAVRDKTGLMLDPYFSASKWKWILDHAEGVSEKLAEGRLLAGNMDSWLIWKLTEGKAHVTDYTNASRTSLFNIHTLGWDEELCRIFGVPSFLLPAVKYSDEKFGYTEKNSWLGATISISGVIGDSQAALFGNLCLEEGMAKATYGTGTSVLMNIGFQPAALGSGLIQTIAWGREQSVTYALEAVIRTSGDSLKWLRENLELFDTFEEMDQLLTQVPSNQGVYLVPAFVGLGAPYWQPNARASISGMNRGTGKAHIIRAALESIAYQVHDAVELLQTASGITLEELRADGGAAENTLLMQFQADILRKKVVRTGVAELSAMGSVFMGGLAVGIWSSAEDLKKIVQSSRTYTPQMNDFERSACLEGWRKAVSALLFQDEGLPRSKE